MSVYRENIYLCFESTVEEYLRFTKSKVKCKSRTDVYKDRLVALE